MRKSIFIAILALLVIGSQSYYFASLLGKDDPYNINSAFLNHISILTTVCFIVIVIVQLFNVYFFINLSFIIKTSLGSNKLIPHKNDIHFKEWYQMALFAINTLFIINYPISFMVFSFNENKIYPNFLLNYAATGFWVGITIFIILFWQLLISYVMPKFSFFLGIRNRDIE